MRAKQLNFLPTQSKAYGGELLKTRKGRAHGRPLDTRNSMHLVLRSTKAKGPWSFKIPHNEIKIKQIVNKFAPRHGIKILSLAIVGNHLHFHIKIANRFGYFAFIRAITAAIAMTISGKSRWQRELKEKFWDYRPFTRIVLGFKAFLTLKDYIFINQLEGLGHSRLVARQILKWRALNSS